MHKIAQRFVHDLHGIPLMLQAMKTFPKEEKLQTSVCAILTNLAAVHSDLRDDMIQLGAIEMVAGAYRMHGGKSQTIRCLASKLMQQLHVQVA